PPSAPPAAPAWVAARGRPTAQSGAGLRRRWTGNAWATLPFDSLSREPRAWLASAPHAGSATRNHGPARSLHIEVPARARMHGLGSRPARSYSASRKGAAAAGYTRRIAHDRWPRADFAARPVRKRRAGPACQRQRG